MENKEKIEKLAQEIHYDSAQQGLDANGCFNQYQGFIKGYTQCQEDILGELADHIFQNEHDWNRNPQAQLRDFINSLNK